MTSNLALSLPSLWQFTYGQGGDEKANDELKHRCAPRSVARRPSYAADSAWEQLVALTHSLFVNLQLATGAAARPQSHKRTVLHVLHRIETLRLALFGRTDVLARPEGKMRIRLTENPEIRVLYPRVGAAPARAA